MFDRTFFFYVSSSNKYFNKYIIKILNKYIIFIHSFLTFIFNFSKCC